MDLSFDLEQALKRPKDRDMYRALANLARMPLNTLRKPPAVRDKIEAALPVTLNRDSVSRADGRLR